MSCILFSSNFFYIIPNILHFGFIFNFFFCRLGSDPEKVFSYETMLEQLKKFASYAIFVGIILIPMLSTNIDTMPDFDSISENAVSDHNIAANMFPISSEAKPAYNKKIVGFINDMARLGYI